MAADNLWRHKLQSLAVLIPLMLVIATCAGMTFVRDGLLQDARLALGMLPDLTVQRIIGGRVERLPVKIGEAIKETPHVRRVVPRIWGYVPLEVKKRPVAYTLMGLDLEQTPIASRIQLSLEAGRFLAAGDRGKLVVGKGFASAFKVRAGDNITLRDSFDKPHNFQVVGIFATAVQIYTADMILTTLEDARQFLGYDTRTVTDLNVYLDDIIYAGNVAQRIITTQRNTRALTRDVLWRLTHQAFGGRSGVFQLMWLILLLASMLIAWAQMTNISLGIKREIGILKAVGWETMDIIQLKLLESLGLGLLGFLGGVALGLGYLLLDAPGLKEYFLSWAAIYPDFPIPMYISPDSLMLLFGVSVFPLLAATVIPAWLLGITDPDQVIRAA